MTDPVLASAGQVPQIATPQKVGFWLQLVTGPGGLADESALAFVICVPVVIIGAFINTFSHTWHFPLIDFVSAVTGLIVLYNASIGARRGLGGNQ